MSQDNRRLWADWVAHEIGGDEARQRTALEAALQALATGRSVTEASDAARAAVGAPPPPPPQPYIQNGVVHCRFCGSVPAVPMTVYEHNGFIVLMQFKNLKGPFCRNCGIHVWRRMTDTTLLRGWLGIFSFFIAPLTVLINLANYPKLTSLPAPQPGSAVRPPADPGPGIFHRPGIYVYAGVVAIVILFFAVPALVSR
jgi:hypothetical protein